MEYRIERNTNCKTTRFIKRRRHLHALVVERKEKEEERQGIAVERNEDRGPVRYEKRRWWRHRRQGMRGKANTREGERERRSGRRQRRAKEMKAKRQIETKREKWTS